MDVISLAYYIAQMRNGQNFPGLPEIPGISYEECLNHVNDYQDFLRPREDFIRQITRQFNNYICLSLDDLVNGNANHEPITPEIYRSVAEQIYIGIAPAAVGRLYPPAATPVNNPVAMGGFDRYITSLHEEDNATRESVEAIIERTNELLAQKTPINQRVSGTVVGRVQSGKTRNYVGLMLKAVEEGWNVIFILTSNSTSLGWQTANRIARDIRYRARINNGSSLNTIGQQNQLQICKKELDDAGNIQNGSFFWGVAIKEKTHLDDIINWLRRNGEYVPQMRILIIDDEADAASPDGQRPEDVWSETEVQSRLDQIGDIPENADEELREQRETIVSWFQSLFPVVESLNDDDVQRIRQILNDGNAGNAQNNFLNDQAIRDLLYLNDYTTQVGHYRVPAADLAAFFIEAGQADTRIKSHRAFVKFIKSILLIASEESVINRKLREIIDRADNANEFTFPFAKCAYIGYTATFYACILNHRPEDTPLYPEFIYSLKKSDRYFGLDEIFGTDLEEAQPRMPIVSALGNELVICQNLQSLRENPEDVEQGAGLYINKQTLDYCLSTVNKDGQLNVQRGSWTTLKEAVAWGFCTAAARRYYNRTTEPAFQTVEEQERFQAEHGDREHCFTSMLINIAVNIATHGTLKNIIQTYLRFQCNQANREAFKQECHRVWNKFTNDPANDACFSAERFAELQGYEAEGYPDWNDLTNDLDWFIDDGTNRIVIQHNSTPDGRNDIERYEDNGDAPQQNQNRYGNEKLWFVCGGYTLSRGLTLPGLTCSYFNGINRTTPVDRLTQMGRWFGYRAHYELLPRIWMPGNTVAEYKKIAMIEEDAHEQIEQAFKNHESPFDGANYITLLYYGRKLSSRCFVMDVRNNKIETASSTYEISVMPETVAQVSQTILEQLRDWDHDGHRQNIVNTVYPGLPIWNVAGNELQDFLNRIMELYPGKSQRMLRGLVGEIDRDEEHTRWDIVWGCCVQQEIRQTPYRVGLFNGWTGAGNPTPAVCNGIAKYSNAISPTAYFAMIEQEHIWQIDANIYSDNRRVILANMQEMIAENRNRGVQNPQAFFEEALGPFTDETLEEVLNRYFDDLVDHPHAIPECIHARLHADSTLEGYRNRTLRDYRLKVYEQAQHGPTLQIYPVVLDREIAAEADLPENTLLYSISFFWPGHKPFDFLEVALAERPTVNITEYELVTAVREILEDYNFLMSLNKLKNRLRNHFADRWNETVWDRYGTQQNGYHRYQGKIAYYANAWAADQDAARNRLIASIRSAVIQILEGRGSDANSLTWRALIGELQEDERFHDLLAIGQDDRDFLCIEVLNEAFRRDNYIEVSDGLHRQKQYRYIGA